MDMFTSYGHIKKPKWNHRFFYDFSLAFNPYIYDVEWSTKTILDLIDTCMADYYNPG